MLYSRLVNVLLILCCLGLSNSCVGDEAAYTVLPHSLVKRIPTVGPGVPIVVFNPLSWERTDFVDIETPFPGSNTAVKITDSAGRVSPARTLGDRLHFTAREVPALGYRVYWAERAERPLPTSIRCTGTTIENEYFRVSVDKSRAVITGIFDKSNSRSLMPAGAVAAHLQFTQGATAKSIREDSTTTMMDSGPARGVLLLDNSLGSQPMVQELILHEGVPRIDIRLTSEWQMPASSSQSAATIRVCFPTLLSTASLDKGGIEFFENGSRLRGVRWVSLTDNGYNICLLADNAHYCDAVRGLLTATLRKQGDPSHGAWEANYSIFAFNGDHSASQVLQRALEVANPLIARVTNQHSGDLPRRGSMISFSRPGLLAALTPGTPTLLRFFDTTGSDLPVPVQINTPGIRLTLSSLSGVPITESESIRTADFVFSPSPGKPTTYVVTWE